MAVSGQTRLPSSAWPQAVASSSHSARRWGTSGRASAGATSGTSGLYPRIGGEGTGRRLTQMTQMRISGAPVADRRVCGRTRASPRASAAQLVLRALGAPAPARHRGWQPRPEIHKRPDLPRDRCDICGYRRSSAADCVEATTDSAVTGQYPYEFHDRGAQGNPLLLRNLRSAAFAAIKGCAAPTAVREL